MEHGEMLNIFIVTLILILLLSSTLTNSWSVASVPGGYEADTGLWKGCMNIPPPVPGPIASKQRDMYPFSKGFTCKTVEELNDKLPTNLNLVRGLSIAGTAFVLISLILYIAMPENVNLFMALLMVGGILSIAAAIVWGTDKDLSSDATLKIKFGYSWYLGLIGGILANIFALLFHFGVIA